MYPILAVWLTEFLAAHPEHASSVRRDGERQLLRVRAVPALVRLLASLPDDTEVDGGAALLCLGIVLPFAE